MSFVFKTTFFATSGKNSSFGITISSPGKFFREIWLKLFPPMQRAKTRQNRSKEMSAQEWCSTKQLFMQAQTHLLPSRIAAPRSLQPEPITPLPYMPDPQQAHTGDLFRAYISSPEHYHPRYPTIDGPLNQNPTIQEPEAEDFPAWLVGNKDRSSLFGITEEDMQPERMEEGNEETIQAPALYQLHVFLRTNKNGEQSDLKQP